MSTIAPQPGAIDARGWGWRYVGRSAWAVRGVSLRIEQGERVLVLGASGSGKSTLLQGIAGVLGGAEDGESEGALRLDGEAIARARGRAGLVLQDPDAQVILARVGDDVAFGCENLGVPRDEIWPRVGEALDAVGLDVPWDRSTSVLSGGQKQRLALAGILAMRPGVVLLDEPTANLDPAGVIEVRDAVARTADRTGATLIVVEHRVEVWLPVVSRVIVLGEGGVVADGTPDAVFAAHGAMLAEAGAWVPGYPPRQPPPPARPPGEVLLSARAVSIARTVGETIARDIDVTIAASTVTAITGPNGVGKSTLGLTLAGLLPAAAGEIIASAELAQGTGSTNPFRWRSRELLTRIGTVLQSPAHQLLAGTVREELEIGPRALGQSPERIRRRVDELLERLRLERLARANPHTLSGGEKRRLTVVAALATAPRILILDEPTFGQDARTWAELVDMLAGVRDAGAAVVAITHDEDVVAALHAQRLALTGVG